MAKNRTPTRNRTLRPARAGCGGLSGPLGCVALMLIAPALRANTTFSAGELPSVTVRFTGGHVMECPTGIAEELVQAELFPDHPFLLPLEPVPLTRFREFYARLGLRLDITPQQLQQMAERANGDATTRQQLEAVLSAADAWLKVPVPQYAPADEYWDAAAPEKTREVDDKAGTIAEMRRTCSLAFALTGEERYAERAWDALAANIGHYYTYGTFRMPFAWESPWDVGYELYDALWAYDLIAHWEGLRPLDHALVFTYLRRLGTQAGYAVELSPVIGSQQAVWTCSLGALAVYAPSMPEAERWDALVQERMYSVMSDFMPDGGQIECDPSQHTLALEQVMRYARACALNGGPDLYARRWPDSGASIEAALDWLARIANPLGETPGINDSVRAPLRAQRCFLEGVTRYKRGDWMRAGQLEPRDGGLLQPLDPGVVPRDPGVRSVLLPDTGLVMMRDGWRPTDSYLLMDYGRHGGAHGHLDKLNIELFADGQPWVLDAGAAPNYATNADLNERWHRQTLAHNTVLVDDESQAPVDGTLTAWRTHPDFDLAAAEHEGYPDLTHRRAVFHPRGGYFLIFDELCNRAERPRALEWLLHVCGRRESGTVGRFLFWRANAHGLSVVLPRSTSLRGVRISEGLCSGCDDVSGSPQAVPVSGDLKPGEPGWAYIPFIGLRRAVAPKETEAFCVVLAPFQGREPDILVDIARGEGCWTVEVRMAEVRDRLLVRKRDAVSRVVRGLGLTTDGKYAYVREVGGKVTVMEWVDGESLSVN